MAEAVACFESALTVAHMQGSRLWELRAMLSLAQHQQELDAEKARELIEPLFKSFEGGLLDLERARDVIR
jgi:hypothetical protein